MVDEELLDCIFEITLIKDIFYAENFNIKSEGLNHRNNTFCKLEPTHKRYCLDYKGNITEIIVAKNENGKIGTVELEYMPEYCMFGNMVTFKDDENG